MDQRSKCSVTENGQKLCFTNVRQLMQHRNDAVTPFETTVCIQKESSRKKTFEGCVNQFRV